MPLRSAPARPDRRARPWRRRPGEAGSRSARTPREQRPGPAGRDRRRVRAGRRPTGASRSLPARGRVARAHRKVRNARADFLHRVSTNLVRRADSIVIEDLAVKNMVKNRALARVISDAGWGSSAGSWSTRPNVPGGAWW
ncbi:transposase [Actinoallomurus sp. NPDC050550]|uniref:transposase n=1 Tax=Actinoallomurus sp. NPDC050550 TaxID=3154937 RepID=UPI0033C54C9A